MEFVLNLNDKLINSYNIYVGRYPILYSNKDLFIKFLIKSAFISKPGAVPKLIPKFANINIYAMIKRVYIYSTILIPKKIFSFYFLA